jgi:hypothetical protein
MDLNNITLSDLIVTEWYGDSALVPSANPVALRPVSLSTAQPASPQPASAAAQPQPTPVPATPIPETPGYKFLGNHRRKVTIIVESPGSAFLPDDELGFLTKILEACRMNIGDVAIINHHTAPVAIIALRQQLQPANILLFGVEPTTIRLPINFPSFKLQPYDQCTYLYAPPLQQMVGNNADAKLLKSKLWVCLKTLFEV